MDVNGKPYIAIEMLRQQRRTMKSNVRANSLVFYTLIYPFIMPAQPNLCYIVRDKFRIRITDMINEYNRSVDKKSRIRKSTFMSRSVKWGARTIKLYENEFVDLQFIIQLFIECVINTRAFEYKGADQGDIMHLDDINDANKIIIKDKFVRDQRKAKEGVNPGARERLSHGEHDILEPLYQKLDQTVVNYMDDM